MEIESMVAANTDGMTDVIAGWQSSLLEMGRRNGLLYFKPGRTAVLIADHTPDLIHSRLDSNRRGLAFDFAHPRRRGRQRGMDEDSAEPEVIVGDLRSDCPVSDLQRRLRNLRRREKEWQDEQGLNVLYVALGLLHWTDQDGEEAVSPLLLLPAQLDKKSPGDPFVLAEDDDDISINHTLVVKLRQEFGVELPDLDDDDIEAPSDYFDQIRPIIESRRGWRIEEVAYLSIFAYSKLAMWNDLERIREEGTDHPVVRALAGDSSAARGDGYHIPSATPPEEMENQVAGGLDDLLDVRDQNAVLPADYSQLITIAGAKSGSNLVVHGPPGTGKSQTIANIISANMAAGKTVLFVSEKTAALDVVKRRLDESGLGVFCLDLHSERGSKSRVYEQLRQSVNDQRLWSREEFDYDSLTRLRMRLNDTVRALHERRQPLDKTVFQMHGRLAMLREVTHAGFDMEDIGELTSQQFEEILAISERIAQRPHEFGEHHTSRWHALRITQPSLELPNTVRNDMEIVASTARQLSDDTTGIASKLGLPKPHSRSEVVNIGNVAEHLSSAPGVPGKWVSPGVHTRLRTIAKREANKQRARKRILDRLGTSFGEPVPDWEYASLREQTRLEPSERQTLEELLGENYSSRLVKPGLATFDLVERLGTTLDDLQSTASELTGLLELDTPDTLMGIQEQVTTASTIANLNPVPESWLSPGGMEAAAAQVDHARRFIDDLSGLEERLFSKFEESILDSVDQQMLARYRTDYQNGLSRFFSGIMGSYKGDRRLLRSLSVSTAKLDFESEFEYVQLTMDTLRRRSEWTGGENALRHVLGHRYRGRDTDWNTVATDVALASGLVSDWKGMPSTLASLLTDRDKVVGCRSRAEMVSHILRQTRELIAQVGPTDADSFSDGQSNLSRLDVLLERATPTLERLQAALSEPVRASSEPLDDLDALGSLLDDGVTLRELEREHENESVKLAADFGGRYDGFDTDWNDVLDALDWCGKLQALLESKRPSDALIQHCFEPRGTGHYRNAAGENGRALGAFNQATGQMEERFDFSAGPWEEWSGARFDDMIEWAQDLSNHADTASDWLIYRAAALELDSAVGSEAASAVRAVTEDARDVPDIVERRLISAWLDRIYNAEPMLANFASSDHDDARAKFRELDERLPVAARNEIRRRMFEKMPAGRSISTAAGQMGVLNRELAKRRRQLSVKRLIERIPSLIQTIKPCFMMSPLAVSQYLPISDLESETLGFDMVIFDEASQVFPEDAIPAILRGKQIVLAGDQKQLPPSSFFRSGASDDDGDDDDEELDQLAGMESILDAAVGQIGSQFEEAHLNVHYRSRDERLIQFSNHYFYDSRLLAFPSPGSKDGWLGLNDVYVPNGVFQNSVNMVEAERVVDLVFEHMRARPVGESLGVVAMSRPQADLISRLIDDRRLGERDLDDRFAEGGAEPFFVKNLENVQGDERDHMILCIGYGPNPLGRTDNRFGPINRAGGERRLNVAVTRAKLRMTVVHSLKASDITAGSQGARLLRRFLEYVANPDTAIHGEAAVDAGADYESPFEAAVGRALTERGYRIARQVGVAGYRVDLAILSEDGSGIDLGIECDGASYHSSPAARDRDWLRQQVLEGLGWRIHRVWSTSWVRNPAGEIEAIERDLEEARSKPPLVFTPSRSSSDSMETSEPEQTQMLEFDKVEAETVRQASDGFEEYRKASIKGIRRNSLGLITKAVVEIVGVEGPIHADMVITRLLDHFGSSRRNSETIKLIEQAMKDARDARRIRRQGDFLWTRSNQKNRLPRRPGPHMERRSIEQIHESELMTAVLVTIREMFGGARDEVRTQTARNLGYQRTGRQIAQRLDEMIEAMLTDGTLTLSFGSIVEANVL